MEKNVVWKLYTKNGIVENDENSIKNLIKINQDRENLKNVIKIFDDKYNQISPPEQQLSSNRVLGEIREELEKEGYRVEKTKKSEDIIKLLEYEDDIKIGDNISIKDEKYVKLFCIDAFDEKTGTVLEVEAGRAYHNNQFLKDFFEACISSETRYLIIAVKKEYRFGNGKYNTKNFEKIKKYFDVLYRPGLKENIPLEALLIIGY